MSKSTHTPIGVVINNPRRICEEIAPPSKKKSSQRLHELLSQANSLFPSIVNPVKMVKRDLNVYQRAVTPPFDVFLVVHTLQLSMPYLLTVPDAEKATPTLSCRFYE